MDKNTHFSSTTQRRLQTALQYGTALIKSYLQPSVFDNVENYCMFLGYPRSGHTLVGSLLDAHPDSVIATELDALRFVERGIRRTHLLHLLLERASAFNRGGSSWTGYNYSLPGQMQGRYRTLRVIGDKKGGRSTWRLRKNPALLNKLRETIRLPIKFIHLVRNPFDNISTILRRNKHPDTGNPLSMDESIKYYFKLCETVDQLKEQIAPEDLIEMHLDDLIHTPQPCLIDLCQFLGLQLLPDYLDACADQIFPSTKKTRNQIIWPAEAVEAVSGKKGSFSFLARYDFES